MLATVAFVVCGLLWWKRAEKTVAADPEIERMGGNHNLSTTHFHRNGSLALGRQGHSHITVCTRTFMCGSFRVRRSMYSSPSYAALERNHTRDISSIEA
jgi:hypothetical protein